MSHQFVVFLNAGCTNSQDIPPELPLTSSNNHTKRVAYIPVKFSATHYMGVHSVPYFDILKHMTLYILYFLEGQSQIVILVGRLAT